MKKLFIAAMAATLMASGATAQFADTNLSQFKQGYNSQADQVPSFFSSIVGNERIEVRVNRSGAEDFVAGAEMNGTRISTIRDGGVANETLIVETDERTIEGIMNSSNPYDAVQKSLEDDDITYRSTTSGGKVKVILFEIAESMLGFL